MSPKNTYTLTVEYFCFEEDELWSKSENDLIELGIEELKNIFQKDFNIIHVV